MAMNVDGYKIVCTRPSLYKPSRQDGRKGGIVALVKNCIHSRGEILPTLIGEQIRLTWDGHKKMKRQINVNMTSGNPERLLYCATDGKNEYDSLRLRCCKTRPFRGSDRRFSRANCKVVRLEIKKERKT